MKKSIICLLCLVITVACVFLFPMEAKAASIRDLEFEITDDDTVIITGCDASASGVLEIPATIGGCPVTAIGEKAFSRCSQLTSVTVPYGVTTIGNKAFELCEKMTSIIIPESVNSIGDAAFFKCFKLKSVIIPYGVTEISKEMFQYCNSLTSVAIPESVTDIGEYAFYECNSLKALTLPKSVEVIGRYAFYNCESLTSLVIPDGVTTIPYAALYYCSSLTSVSIPDSVTQIDNQAFYKCSSLPWVIIPDGVTDIGDQAFYYCTDLKAVAIPDTVTGIGYGGFAGCDALEHIAYSGTLRQWNNIDIQGNNPFTAGDVCFNAHLIYMKDCENRGLFCDICEQFVIKDSPQSGEHSYNKTVTYPTLTAHGYTQFTCWVCGHSYIANYTFPDVPNTLWSYNAVEFAVAKGYFSGYKSGNFGPTDQITRQDFVVVLARIAGVNLNRYSGRTGFSDVPAGSYYEAAVKWASSNGVVMGYKNGKFGVGDKITREQLVTILYRYAKKMGYNTYVPAGEERRLYKFADANQVTSYAKEAVIWALYNGVISGMTSTTVGPQNNASRGQVATILMNICQKSIMPI